MIGEAIALHIQKYMKEFLMAIYRQLRTPMSWQLRCPVKSAGVSCEDAIGLLKSLNADGDQKTKAMNQLNRIIEEKNVGVVHGRNVYTCANERTVEEIRTLSRVGGRNSGHLR
jgi:hypothetical protein